MIRLWRADLIQPCSNYTRQKKKLFRAFINIWKGKKTYIVPFLKLLHSYNIFNILDHVCIFHRFCVLTKKMQQLSLKPKESCVEETFVWMSHLLRYLSARNFQASPNCVRAKIALHYLLKRKINSFQT